MLQSTSLIPPSDLLEKIEGLEAGLRRRRNLSRFGLLGGVLAALASLFTVLRGLEEAGLFVVLLKLDFHWLLVLATGFVLLFLAAWLTYWLKESRYSIRYTCSLGDFSAVKSEEDEPATPVDEKIAWLPHDLARRLNLRVKRLMFSREAGPAKQPAEEADGGTGRPTDQHIHIDGDYLVRKAPHGSPSNWEVVVMPRVRIGPERSPEKLARPVDFPVRGGDSKLSDSDYNQLVEQVYFSVVNEIYEQISKDVERKIELLPTRHHKAVAYYHEAEDYARSNTLRAYDEANKLYLKAVLYFEPFNPLVADVPRSIFDWEVSTLGHLWAGKLRRLFARYRPGAAKSDILAARAKLGCANMLVFRRLLSSLVGQQRVPIFQARPFAERTLVSLERLPRGTPGYEKCLFDAHVTNALVMSLLGDQDDARMHLNKAEKLVPERATTSPIYLLAKSYLPSVPRTKYETLLRAVERDPHLEVAQFSTAFEREMTWRSGPTPTRALCEADMVINGYQDVLRLNPGNIAAAANAAFVFWVLGEKQNLKEAKNLFHDALHYKDLAPETVVAEHNYGLARICAEWGEFEQAYKHLIKAEDGVHAHRLTHDVDIAAYIFRQMADDLLRRYKRYCKRVLEKDNEQQSNEKNAYARNAVCAFVLGEYGEACRFHYNTHSLDPKIREQAIWAFNQSIKRNKNEVMSHYRLAQVYGDWEDFEKRTSLFEEVIFLDPNWQEAHLELAQHKAREPAELMQEAKNLRELGGLMDDLREQREERLGTRAVGAQPWSLQSGSRIAEGGTPNEIEKIRRKIKELEGKLLTTSLPLPDNADGLKKLADRKNREAKELLVDAQQKASELLPHKWLYLETHDPETEDISSSPLIQSLTDPHYSDEAKWEREFNDVHAKAFYSWIRPLLGVPEYHKQVGLLLDHIRRIFYPANFDVFLDCLDGIERRRRNACEDIEGIVQAIKHTIDELPPSGDTSDPEILQLEALRDALEALKETLSRLPEEEEVKKAEEYLKYLEALKGKGSLTEKLEQDLEDILKTSQHVLAHCQNIPEYKKMLGRIVQNWLQEDPTHATALWWLNDQRIEIEPEDKVKLVETALKLGSVPSQLKGIFAKILMERGDEHLNSDKNKKAAEKYKEVSEIQADVPETAQSAGKLAILLFVEGEMKEANELVERSLPETYTILPSALKNPHGDMERLLVLNESARIQLKLCYERHLRKTADKDRNATDAVMGLLDVAGVAYVGSEPTDGAPGKYLNARLPLAIEWDEQLLPPDADVDGFLVNDAAPGLRKRLEAQYGVRVPGVRFRAIEGSTHSGLYRILDHDVVVEEDTVSAASQVIERLEAYLERHLSQWIRVQEVQNLLERHCGEWYHGSIPDSIPEIETQAHIGPLTTVIRSLVAERVPIREFREIYNAYRNLSEAGEHVQTITREIRKLPAIRPELWGNNRQYSRYVLPESTEAELLRACESIDGFTVLVLQPERRRQLISAMVKAVRDQALPSLTVKLPELRSLARRLIEHKLPDMPVLAEDEVDHHVCAIEPVEITIPRPSDSQEVTN